MKFAPWIPKYYSSKPWKFYKDTSLSMGWDTASKIQKSGGAFYLSRRIYSAQYGMCDMEMSAMTVVSLWWWCWRRSQELLTDSAYNILVHFADVHHMIQVASWGHRLQGQRSVQPHSQTHRSRDPRTEISRSAIQISPNKWSLEAIKWKTDWVLHHQNTSTILGLP